MAFFLALSLKRRHCDSETVFPYALSIRMHGRPVAFHSAVPSVSKLWIVGTGMLVFAWTHLVVITSRHDLLNYQRWCCPRTEWEFYDPFCFVMKVRGMEWFKPGCLAYRGSAPFCSNELGEVHPSSDTDSQ
jgi:hypothetical protein